MKRRQLLLAVPAGAVTAEAAAGTQVVRFVRPPDRLSGERWYPFRLLQAALEASGEPWEIEAREWLTQRRAERELSDPRGVIDVYAMGGSLERERRLQLLPLPIYRGLFGWRLLLVRPDRVDALRGLADLQALRGLRLIQGEDWPDTPILRGSGLRVLGGGTQLHRLHEALQQGHADAFPRAVPEAWNEMDADAQRLAVLPGLALHYRYDVCFYCRRGDQRIAPALWRGLQALQRSGRFESLLLEHHGGSLERSALAQRQVIRLPNPWLPQALRRLPASAWNLAQALPADERAGAAGAAGAARLPLRA
jgi:hypothetical protein